MAQPPRPADPNQPHPNQAAPAPHPAAPAPGPGPVENSQAQAQTQAPEDAQAKRDKEAIEASLHPKDFKLAKPGSKDYVAGQPVDEKELGEVTAEAEKRMQAGHDPKAAGGTAHEKSVQQYGPEGAPVSDMTKKTGEASGGP